MLKNIVPVVLFFLGLFLFARFGPAIPFSVSQITTNKSDLFTVTGEGKVFVKPDIALVTIGFTTSGSTVATVQDQANKTLNNISSSIKRTGVEDKDLQTTNYNLRPDYDFNSGRQTIKGYVIDANLQVKVRDFAKINQVIDAATGSGANQIGGLSFTLDDVEKYRSQARAQAIEEAKRKAQSLASQTGITLGRIVNVTESGNSEIRPMMMSSKSDSAAPSAANPTQIESGNQEISVSVALSYETR